MTPEPLSPAGENRSLSGGSRAADTDPGRTGASVPQPPRGTLARTPPPVTRAASGRAAARGRGGAVSPAVGAGANPVPSAGSKAAGREAYELARRKALRQGRRPADPQQAPGRPGAPARVAALMRPCVTVLPGGGVCGATGYEHDTGTRAGAEVRTRCSIATAAGPCGCRVYAPQPETPGGEA
jgi:hypothetical protein